LQLFEALAPLRNVELWLVFAADRLGPTGVAIG
jgi:hypothetical protein